MKWCIGAAVIALPGVASASFLVETQEFSVTSFQPNATFTFMRAGEFSSLPLKAVVYEHTLLANGGGFEVDNDGPNAGTVNYFRGATGTISSADLTIPSLQVNAVNEANASLGPDDETGGTGPIVLDIGGDDYFELDPLVDESDTTVFSPPEVLFSEYTGTGTFDIFASVNQSFGVTGDIVADVAFNAFPLVLEATLTISYVYAPAPGALALLPLGGLVAMRRRRV